MIRTMTKQRKFTHGISFRNFIRIPNRSSTKRSEPCGEALGCVRLPRHYDNVIKSEFSLDNDGNLDSALTVLDHEVKANCLRSISTNTGEIFTSRGFDTFETEENSITQSINCSKKKRKEILQESSSTLRSDDRLATEKEVDLPLRHLVSDESSESDSMHYIFTDDDEDVRNYLVEGNEDYVSSRKDPFQASSYEPHSKSNSIGVPSTTQDWSSFQQQRGRLIAQRLLEEATRKTDVSSNLSSPLRNDVASFRKHRRFTSTYIGRALKSLRTRITNSKIVLGLKPREKAVSISKTHQVSEPVSAASGNGSYHYTKHVIADFDNSCEVIIRNKNEPRHGKMSEDGLASILTANMRPTHNCFDFNQPGTYAERADFVCEPFQPLFSNAFGIQWDDDLHDIDDEVIIFRNLLEDPTRRSEEYSGRL